MGKSPELEKVDYLIGIGLGNFSGYTHALRTHVKSLGQDKVSCRSS